MQPALTSLAHARYGTHSPSEKTYVTAVTRRRPAVEVARRAVSNRGRGTCLVSCPGQEHRLLNDGDEEFMFYSVWWDEEMAEKFIARNREEVRA